MAVQLTLMYKCTFYFFAGGHGTFSNLVNNMVHVVMYCYYMISAMGPQYQKYLWWKKHLTSLQLVIYDYTIYIFKFSFLPFR